jgi:hypothetical protein
MGGTPVLRLLAEDLAGVRVLALRGIVNGTTNYILTEMATNGSTYETALAAAQAAGYAEADPAGDVEGGDAADKLVILARLAFGGWLDRASVSTGTPGHLGITGVTADDLARAAERGEALRLLASASRRAPGGPIVAAVRTEAVACAIDWRSRPIDWAGSGSRVPAPAARPRPRRSWRISPPWRRGGEAPGAHSRRPWRCISDAGRARGGRASSAPR